MPSSTSSSKERIPSAPHGRQLLLTLVLAASMIAGLEWHHRSGDFAPSVTESKLFWSRERARLTEHKDALVFIGASRLQLALNEGAVREHQKGRPSVNLTLDGTAPLAVLLDLSNDATFSGTIVMSAAEYHFSAFSRAKGVPWVRYFREQFPRPKRLDERIDDSVRVFLQANLASFSAHLNLRRLVASGFEPKRLYLHMSDTRYRPAWYSTRMTEAERQRQHAKRLKGRKKWFKPYEVKRQRRFTDYLERHVKPAYERLRKRGAKLVLVRMPTTGAYAQLDNAQFPRHAYWDRITPLTGVPTIHFSDVPFVSTVECPDGSHIDASDSEVFTRHLLEAVDKALQ